MHIRSRNQPPLGQPASRPPGSPAPAGAFTLVELVMAAGIGAMVVSSVIYGYLMASQRAEWSGYSLAANSLVSMKLEQARACKWDPLSPGVVDELVTANFPVTVDILDIPRTGTNVVYATNFTTISTVSTIPPVRMIQVSTTWKFYKGRVYTNTMVTYRGPDQ